MNGKEKMIQILESLSMEADSISNGMEALKARLDQVRAVLNKVAEAIEKKGR